MSDQTKNPTGTQAEQPRPEPAPRQPLAAHCHACGHVWAVIWLPCNADDMPRRFTCPHCSEKKRIYIASAENAAKIARPLICEVPSNG